MKPIDHETLENGAQEIARPLVVHVVRQFLPNRGGLEDVVFNLCMQSIDRGLRVRVVTLDSLFSDPEMRLAERHLDFAAFLVVAIFGGEALCIESLLA